MALGRRRKWLSLSALLVTGLGVFGFWFQRKVWFYRDPKRVPDERSADAIISPADGQVLYIKPVSSGNVVSEKLDDKIAVSELAKVEGLPPEGWLFGIYMSPFDVHFNYAPVDGKLTKMFHTQAKTNLPMVDLWEYVRLAVLRRGVNLFGKRYHLTNERNTMIVADGDRAKVAIVEIADKFVNKITPFVAAGQTLEVGQKIAFIERGSQVDLIVFDEVVPAVSVGDQVYGGKTVLAHIKRAR